MKNTIFLLAGCITGDVNFDNRNRKQSKTERNVPVSMWQPSLPQEPINKDVKEFWKQQKALLQLKRTLWTLNILSVAWITLFCAALLVHIRNTKKSPGSYTAVFTNFRQFKMFRSY